MTLTKKDYEELLNREFSADNSGWNKRSGSRKRSYGTWLRSADREKFNADYAAHLAESEGRSTEGQSN